MKNLKSLFLTLAFISATVYVLGQSPSPTDKNLTLEELPPLNVKHMLRGYFYASSPHVEEFAGYGGWGGSGNDFKKIEAQLPFEKEKFSIMVDPNAKSPFAKSYLGQKLYVANSSTDTLYFEAQDSRLSMKIQALDKHGEWKDIEYLAGSSCGNSFHTLFLPPDHYWEFVTPVYKGRFKTKLRAELKYQESFSRYNNAPVLVLYSNEFEGAINPAQLSKIKPYQSSGIMDPYDN